MKPFDRDNQPCDPEQDRIERAAADWLVQRDRGFDDVQAERWAQWMESDPRHARAFGQMETTWDYLGKLQPAAPSRIRRDRRFWAVLAGSLAAAAAVAFVLFWRPSPSPHRNFSEVAKTMAGTLRRMELPDGSILQLSSSSEVEIEFTTEFRRVRLIQGQLHLEAAKNPARPFLVSVGPVVVRAVGTAFGVKWRASGPIEVVVVEGKVRVDDSVNNRSLLTSVSPGETPLLVAGQLARIEMPRLLHSSVSSEPVGAAQVTSLAPKEMDAAQEWRTHYLQFGLVPLREIVSQFNRYNDDYRIIVADPVLAERQFGGTFLIGDYQTFIRQLEENYGIRVERRAGVSILHPN